MSGKKRGPYRQYLRQDEPFLSRALQKKLRRSKKESKHTPDLPVATEFASEFENAFDSSGEERQDYQEQEKIDTNLDECSKDTCALDWSSEENYEHVSSGDIDYSSDLLSCSSAAGTVYDFDSDNTTDGSDYDDCDEEQPHDNDPPLYEGASLSISSSILLTLSFVLKHRLTGQCFSDLLAVIEAHCPKPNYCKTSVRKLFDYFKNIKGNLVKHMFCTFCKGYICEQRQEESVILPDSCRICGTRLANNTSFFLEAPLADQITKLFKDQEFVNGLEHRFHRRKQAEENIEDVYDGKLYKDQFQPGGFLSQQFNMSFKVNTDGVAVFKSSKFGVWPLFLSINELPPHLRSLSKNRLFSGLWFGDDKPFFSTFFKPFVDKICAAQVQGFEVELPREEAATSRVMVLSGHFDLPARSAVLEQVSYSGHDSCCYCTEKGETVSTSARGHVVTFPFRDTPTGHAELRTSKDIEHDSLKALHENSSVNGFRSPSPLFGLPGFSIPLGVSIDYMHGVCLGVVKTLVGLWFDTNTGKNWCCGHLVHQVDSRLLGIKPPSAITRVPRSIDSHRKHWKAAEYRSWLFFYSLPCMKGILSDDLFNHYALLVGGIYLLCQESISPADLRKAEMLLAHFVEMFDVYYAPRYVLLNVHNLLHLVEDVNANGPLWCNSLFVFEDWNGDISDFFHGTQNVANQILSAVSCRQNMPELIAKMPDGQAKDLVLKLRNGSERENKTPIGEGINIVGALRNGGLRPEFEDDVVSGLEVDSLNEVKFFARVQIRGRIIHSRAYKRVSVRNSYTVSYKDNNEIKYGQVEVFVQASSPRNDSVKYAAVILPFLQQTGFVCPTYEVLGVCPVTHIVCCSPPLNDQCVLIPIDNIEDICVYMELRDTGLPVVYIAHFPNHIEKD